MKIYTLSGPSGTGKSTSALSFAHSKGISTIIDDGLLIHKGRRAAGTSAKYEKSYITAVKRAIFFHDSHLKEVQEAIRSLAIDKILVIGTSRKMVERIVNRLELGTIDYYYSVEEVRSSKEIKMALYNRKTQEKHVIPLPYTEVEQNIFKRIISRGKKILFQQKEWIGETTIVQPNFQDGIINIYENVFKQIISKSCTTISHVKKCNHVRVDLDHLPQIQIDVTIAYLPDQYVMNIVKNIQQKVFDDFVHYFNIEPHSIDVYISELSIDKKG